MKLIGSKCYLRSTDVVRQRGLWEHWGRKRKAIMQMDLRVGISSCCTVLQFSTLLLTCSCTLLGSKRQHEAHNTKRSNKGRLCDPNKVRHLDGSRRANKYQRQEATSSTQATCNETESSRAFRSTRGRVHESAELDAYQAPAYPLQASSRQIPHQYQAPAYPLQVSSRQIPHQYQVNSQSWNGSNEFIYHERDQIPNMRRFPHLSGLVLVNSHLERMYPVIVIIPTQTDTTLRWIFWIQNVGTGHYTFLQETGMEGEIMACDI
jgi:hypothetical protein